MKISVAQFAPSGVLAENLVTMQRLAEKAAGTGAELVLFPEESIFTVGEIAGDFVAEVQRSWAVFEQGIQQLARQNSIAIIAGGYEPSETGRPFNTLLAIDANGNQLAKYRKIHLYDAFSYRESERITPGDGGPVTVEIAGLRIGLLTCYDLRFPELARTLVVDYGADLLCVPAAWFAGGRKQEHWQTLLAARAIENTCWVAAAGSSSKHCIGDSMVVDPMGVPIAELGNAPEAIATVEISRARLEEVRKVLPALQNRVL